MTATCGVPVGATPDGRRLVLCGKPRPCPDHRPLPTLFDKPARPIVDTRPL